MAGEDPETTELKAGQRIGLVVDQNEEVEKIVINRRDQFSDIRMFEVEQADLEHKLYIMGYEDGEDERVSLHVKKDAVFVEDGVESQIAPWDRQFASKSLGQRAMAIFAGPMMNFVLAILIFMLLAIIQGVPTNDPLLGPLTEDGAAKQAGLQAGDKVLEIDGKQVSTWSDIVKVIQKNPNQKVDFNVSRNGETLDIPVTPKMNKIEGESIGIIGVHSPVEKSPQKVITYGFTETYNWTIEIFHLLGKLVTGQFSIDALSGPVGIYVSTDTVLQSGVFYAMRWAAILSINLGIMNLLPIPALDGGRLMFFLVEALRGKPIDRQKEGVVHFIGFALLMVLMVVVTWNDIQRFFLQ